jgi:diguanylate cyclase (GGDEF)-like protein
MNKIRFNIFNATTLAFSDITLEKSFQQYYFEKTLVQVRVILVFAAILYTTFGFLDNLVIPEIRLYTWLVRIAAVSPLLLLTYGLTYTRFYRKWMRSCLFFAGIVSGAGIVEMIVMAPSPGNHLYYSGVLLCVLFYFVFIPDFLTSTLLSWSLFFLYLFMVVCFSHINTPVLMNNASAFFAFNIAGMFAAFSIERYMRSDFLQRRTIHERTEDLRLALLEVEKARGKAEMLSQTDPLTETFNRRHFFSLTEKELERNARNRHCIAAIMLDIDHFKNVNDTHGHRVGDMVLQEIAGQIRSNVRSIDITCRYGGEEFAILLPETDHIEAESVACRLKQGIEAMRIFSGREFISVTASIGVAALPEGDHVEADVLLEMADLALYEAKKSGRNQVKRWNGRIYRDRRTQT